MTIVINQPDVGAYVGAGMFIYVTVDGPTAYDDIVTASVNTSTSTLIYGARQTFGGTFMGVQLGWDDVAGQLSAVAQAGGALGADCYVQVLLKHITGVVVEVQNFTGFFHDPVSGWLGLLSHVHAGTTTTHDPMLDQILANTQGGTFQSPLIGIMTTTHATGSPFTGGSAVDITPPSIPLTNVVGLTWNATTIPDVGRGTVGVIEESSRRVLQIVVFHTLAPGTTFADQVVETRGVAGSLFFDSWNPTTVSVYIWPGFTVEVDWLLAP